MIFDGITNKVFNAVIQKLQGNIDNIQTTSRATLSQAGWYRVATYNRNSATYLKGSFTNSCVLTVKMSHTNSGGESFVVALSSTQNNQVFDVLRSHGNGHATTKVRYTYDDKKAYLEIYYSIDKENKLSFEITSTEDAGGTAYAWQAITPTLTSETVDGVTVTTTYDIPANASPVTDLDLANYLPLGGSLTTNYNKVSDLNNFYSGMGLFTEAVANVPSSSYWLVVAGSAGTGTVIQVAFDLLRNKGAKQRYCGSGTWQPWGELTLEGYFKNTGGEINGNIIQNRPSAIAVRRTLKNSLREIQEYIGDNGDYLLVDVTNNKVIYRSNSDGTTTANLTASGNIAKEGGTTVQTIKSSTLAPFAIHNTTDTSTESYMRFYADDTLLGGLGFYKVDTPRFLATDGTSKYLLHSGNSARLEVSETPLTAAGAVRVW